MALTSGRDVLRAAREGRYAVPAFNVFNLEMLQAAYAAAEAEQAPVIVQVSPRSVAYAGLRPIAVLAIALAESVRVPVVLHLDHGPGVDACRDALAQGFSSVMYDGADLPYAENVARTREVVAAAHARDAAAEAELGQVGHAREGLAHGALTGPREAGQFAAETGVDALAVAIGTVHGMTATGAVLDIPRIAALAREVDAVLVMHGSSGVDDDTMRAAVAAGIRKVNLSTALQKVFMETLRRSAAAPGHETDARAVLEDARDAVIAAARHRIRLLGAAGKA
ncbi:MAG: class II fructose-bisphosphate aldolase [Thermomicrobiales bacterium]